MTTQPDAAVQEAREWVKENSTPLAPQELLENLLAAYERVEAELHVERGERELLAEVVDATVLALGCEHRGELPDMVRRLGAERDSFRRERDDLKESVHYANGVRELAMKHRDQAEQRVTALEAALRELAEKWRAKAVRIEANLRTGNYQPGEYDQLMETVALNELHAYQIDAALKGASDGD